MCRDPSFGGTALWLIFVPEPSAQEKKSQREKLLSAALELGPGSGVLLAAALLIQPSKTKYCTRRYPTSSNAANSCEAACPKVCLSPTKNSRGELLSCLLPAPTQDNPKTRRDKYFRGTFRRRDLDLDIWPPPPPLPPSPHEFVDAQGYVHGRQSSAAMAPQLVDKIYLPDLEPCLKGETIVL